MVVVRLQLCKRMAVSDATYAHDHIKPTRQSICNSNVSFFILCSALAKPNWSRDCLDIEGSDEGMVLYFILNAVSMLRLILTTSSSVSARYYRYYYY